LQLNNATIGLATTLATAQLTQLPPASAYSLASSGTITNTGTTFDVATPNRWTIQGAVVGGRIINSDSANGPLRMIGSTPFFVNGVTLACDAVATGSLLVSGGMT